MQQVITRSRQPALSASVAGLARRARPLVRLAGEYTAAHVAGRALAAAAGLVLVRLLPISEYALYTLLLAGYTFITTSSDLGATESLTYFRRRAVLENRPWSVFYRAVVRFRGMVYLGGLLLSCAYVFYTATRIEREARDIVAAVAVMGGGAWLAIRAGTTSYALKLELRFREAYAVELSNEATKLLAVVLLWMAGIATALAGMVSVGLGSLVAVLAASALWQQPDRADTPQDDGPGKDAMRALLGQVGPVLPGTIYYSVQAPLVAYLAATYGSAGNVAEVGALGRLAALISVFSGFSSSVFVPRLAAIKEPSLFRLRYLHWWVIMLLFSGAVMLAVGVFPESLLWILGRSYSGLHEELIIAAASAVVAIWGAYTWQINRARGWVRAQPYRVPVVATAQLLLFAFLDLSTTKGILMFGFGSLLTDILFQLSLNAFGLLADSRDQ
jgi:hypothetical protein